MLTYIWHQGPHAYSDGECRSFTGRDGSTVTVGGEPCRPKQQAALNAATEYQATSGEVTIIILHHTTQLAPPI